MPIKPIDIVTMAPKSQEVSQYKQQESQRTFNEQTQISNQFNSQIQHNNKQAVKTLKGENQEYRYDAKEKGNSSYTNSKKKEGKEKDKNTDPILKDKFHSGSIDIKI
jgi:hypothetical protein